VTDAIQRAIPNYTNGLNNAADTSARVAKVVGAAQSHDLKSCLSLDANGESDPLNCGPAPAVAGITHWLNTPNGAALTLAGLKGKVVLVDFWAYSCINCQRAIKHVNAWYAAYKSVGLEVIGVHAPEYAFEQVTSNVRAGAQRMGITYPIAQDNRYVTWNNYGNASWPADYLVDSTGTVRYVSMGEGDYDTTESLIRRLLIASHPGVTLPRSTQVADRTPDDPLETRETYLDSTRASNFGDGNGSLAIGTRTFSYPTDIRHGQFALTGRWTIGDESMTARKGAAVELRYDASDVYLDVGGTGTITATVDGRSVTYHVNGAPNIYRVVHAVGPGTGLLRVTLSPGLQAYSFTFG
jgi:thiol-disulfide isomerase/thioredoxin